MLLSMTGYGRITKEFDKKSILVEVRSLNSKYFDLKAKIPQQYREKEIEIHRIVKHIVQRGKIDLTVEIQDNASETFSINKTLFTNYYRELRKLSNSLRIQQGDIMATIMKLPNIVQTENEQIDNDEWLEVKIALGEALQKFNKFRIAEGSSIEKDFRLRVLTILQLLEKITPFEEMRIEKMRTRLQQNFDEQIANNAIDANRFEQEILYYLEKMDITEEKVRLRQHCHFFIEQLDNKEIAKGRKLNFISQEMGREINTLGSKASYSEIQHIVVAMKDELEKIKEQLSNAV